MLSWVNFSPHFSFLDRRDRTSLLFGNFLNRAAALRSSPPAAQNGPLVHHCPCQFLCNAKLRSEMREGTFYPDKKVEEILRTLDNSQR